MSISYKNIYAFVVLSESVSFSQAAEKLYLSQPALSTAMRNLEAQLGGQLLSRSTRKVALTPEGRYFLPKAKRLIHDWENTMDDVKAYFAMQHGNLIIAAMPSFADSILPQLLNRYHQKFPGIRIRVLDVVMEEAIKSVEEGRAELGFVFEPEKRQGIAYEPIMQDSFCVVMKPNHPLASESVVNMGDVSNYTHVAMNKGSSVRLWVYNVLANYDITPNIIAEAYQLGTLGQLINYATQDSEQAVAIVPSLCRQQMLSKGLICVSLDEPLLSKSVGVVTSLHHPLSSAGQQMLGFIRG